jgi:hypothetical protein
MDSIINDLTPGETAEWTFKVSGLADGESVASATLEIRDRLGSLTLPVKSITNNATSDGWVETLAGNAASLKFNLSESETEALSPVNVFYVFSVALTTTDGRKQYVIPTGRITPSRKVGSQSKPLIKISAGRTTLKVTTSVRATKT